VYAAYVTALGPPTAIRHGELPDPVPGPGEVLVEVAASAVDPVDTLVRSGRFRTPTPFPFVVGRDLVGRVRRAGDGMGGFAAGDRVWCNSMGHGGRQGAAAELVAAPVDRLYRLPDGVDDVAAVAVLHPAATAHLALFRHGDLRAGETVYVAGGAGHVGRTAILMADRAGARVVASAAADGLRECRELGADVALDYRATDLDDRLRVAAPDGVDVHLDTSGREDLASAVHLLRQRGRIVVIAGTRPEQRPPVRDLYTRDGTIAGFAISNAAVAELADAAEHVNRLLVEGVLRPAGVETMPLRDAARAHERLENGRARGVRLVLLP
jgi:NADPH:quinone reductase-like Zn-dependent oxidoreductase